MAYDVPQLLKMSQKELDDLFTKSSPGDIPDGEAQGTAIVAPGTTYSAEIATLVNHFAWQGKTFDGKKGFLKNRILPFGFNAIIARIYKARRQGVHRPGLLGHLPRRAVDPRRDPADRPRPLPRQGLLEPEAPHGLRPEVLSGP